MNKVLPSVVYIYMVSNQTSRRGHPVEGAGTGIIMRADGYILTNRHVVENAKSLEVTLYDRRVYQVNPSNVWMDDIVDLAVVKIDEGNLPTLNFADPDTIAVGDWVVAVGHAMGLSPVEGGATVTNGIVSNLGRSVTVDTTTYYDLVQTNAAINPGNSGGPLVNLAGDVVGVNSVGETDAQNIGYAINAGTARHVYEDMVQYGKPQHPYLGVTAGDITPDIVRKMNTPRQGALVTKMAAQAPAQAAGLLENDVIISFGKRDVGSAADLVKQLWRHEPGDSVDIVFWRSGAQRQTTMKLGDRPPQTTAI